MKKLNKPVLAEGEVTGHVHVLQGNIDVFETDSGTREFNLSSSTELIHEEHKPVTIPTGNYVSGKVQEFDHYLEESRAVKD